MSNDAFWCFEPEPQKSDTVIRSTVATWRTADPGCSVLALVSERDRGWITELQALCQALALPLVGGVFPALLQDGEIAPGGVWLLRLGAACHHSLVAPLGETMPAAEAIASAVRPHLNGSVPTLLLLFDAMLPNIASILDALYLRLGDGVRYIGANVGSGRFQPIPSLFDASRQLAAGVACLLLPAEVETALGHGYEAPELPVTATTASGNLITSIDWQPAFTVYSELVRKRYAITLDQQNFYQYAVHFPFGIALANGQFLVRIPVALEENQAIACIGEIPGNSLMTILEPPQGDSHAFMSTLAKRLLSGGTGVERLLCFYCAGRYQHMGAGAHQELAALMAESGARLAGALSLGEIGGLEAWSYPLLHNAAVVCATWGESCTASGS